MRKNGSLRGPSIIQFLTNAGLFASTVFIPVLARELGATRGEIGIIVAAYGLAVFVSSYIFGRLSDINGRRRYLLLGLALSAFSAILQIFARTPLELGIVRFTLGFTAGIFPPALLAYAYDSHKKMGRFSSYGSLGWGAGVMIAGLLGIYYRIFLFTSILLFVSFFIALHLQFTEAKPIRVPLFPLSLIKKNAGVYMSMIIRHSSANMIWVTYPIFIESLGADHLWIGIIYGINPVVQFFAMGYIERYREEHLIYAGLLLSSLTFISFTLARTPYELIPSQFLLGVSWSCLYVGSLKRVLKKNEEKATATGLLSSAISISMIAGSLLGGIFSQLWGFHGPMYIAGAITFLALLYALKAVR